MAKALYRPYRSEETCRKISAALMKPEGSLKAVPTRLRQDQIDHLKLIQGDTSFLIRTAVDLFLSMVHIREYTPEQAAAIAEYEKIGAEFPVGVIFIFNPQTLGGTFFYNRESTAIANPEELSAVWDKQKPKPEAAVPKNSKPKSKTKK